VRSNGIDEVLARAVNRGAYREAARLYADELIELRQGARVIEPSRNVAEMWPTRHRNHLPTNCVESLAE
jgi:hypothetical protein